MYKKLLTNSFLIFKFSAAVIYAGPAEEVEKAIIENDIYFNRFSVEQGLSQSTVHSILQDRNGFIWVGTLDGLNRFDGFRFTVYSADRNDSTSLSNDLIHSIIQDKQGFIWAGTDAGLNLLTLIKDGSGNLKEAFVHFKHDPENESGLPDDEIRTLFCDRSGVLWLGTAMGLVKAIVDYDKIKKGIHAGAIKFIHYKNNPGDPSSLTSDYVSAIEEDSSGNLWIGTMGGGLNLFDREKEKFNGFTNYPESEGGLTGNYIMNLFTDRDGELWIGTYGSGLFRLIQGSENFINYKKNSSANSISDDRIYDIDQDDQGNIWIATFGNGIDKFNPLSGKFTNFRNIEYDPETLSNNFTRCIFIDGSQNIWIGTNRGLNKADLKPPKFIHFKNDPWKKPSLSDNYVLSILEDKRGKLWIGTNKGLDRYDPEKGTYINYSIPHNNPRNSEGFVYTMQQDETGHLWLGTFGGGIYKFDQRTGKISRQYLHQPGSAGSLADNRVVTIFTDTDGSLLIGTVSGICRFDKKNEKFSDYFITEEVSSLLKRKRINAILKDKNGDYWIGTEQGLYKINTAEGICTVYTNQSGSKDSLSNNSVLCLFEDEENRIWIGTEEGLNVYYKKKNCFFHYFKKDGLPGNSISNIISDEEGYLWITAHGGISKFNIKSGISRNYDLDDGLQGLEFNNGALFRNKEGEIYFGGINGYNKFNPASLKENYLPPRLVLTAFKKFDKTVKGSLELSQSKSLELSYDDRFFSFEFAALDFTNPERNQYACMLEGFDNEWMYSGNINSATYTNIDPGEYIFRVKGSNNDGIWNEEGIALRIKIFPPFYKTWWAYLVYGLIIIALLFSLRRFETAKRKRKEEALLKELELKEVQLRAEKAELQAKTIETEKEIEKQNIRYRIASDLHDEIGSNLSSITLLSSILTRNFSGVLAGGNGSGNPAAERAILEKLRDINTAAKSSAESIRDIVWFINPVSDKLSNLVLRMKESAAMMLVGINYTINSFQTDDENIDPEVKRNVYLIYKEILNNIIRHSGADSVDILIEKKMNSFMLSVEDNGRGFNEPDVRSGNGLKNLRTRTENIGGKIKIKSEPGKGTYIFLQVTI